MISPIRQIRPIRPIQEIREKIAEQRRRLWSEALSAESEKQAATLVKAFGQLATAERTLRKLEE